ncbi:MAG: hypothetical protein K6T81_03000 [Alicyclobacillus macrosporangiidus]|uniref:hypothetical protein n=1 Tax=Alicyclobacillus macrosporangiidus TaxID=392015 RepID=UPI0026EC7E38|nr:hypothetical protein [Alicyclobacillus macrosporangiidus]MCL6597690.1 hypothetical protein [Alicyclobacillus macrosporangiidus]
MNVSVWNDLLTILGTAVTVLAGLFGINRRWPLLTKTIQWLEHDGATLIEDVGKLAKDVSSAPFFQSGASDGGSGTAGAGSGRAGGSGRSSGAGGAAEASGTPGATPASDALLRTELARVALVGLHAFGQALDSLSADQKKALAFYIASRVPGVTEQEIEAALQAMQREADAAARSALFQSANAFTEAQKTLQWQQERKEA